MVLANTVVCWANTVVFVAKTVVFWQNTVVLWANTAVFVPNTVVFGANTLIFGGNTVTCISIYLKKLLFSNSGNLALQEKTDTFKTILIFCNDTENYSLQYI